jgi:hypothetical protein
MRRRSIIIFCTLLTIVFFNMAYAGQWQASLFDKLDAYYNFETTSGDIIDLQGNYSTSAFSGVVRGVTGKSGFGLNFTTGDSLTVDTQDQYNAFTVNLWIKEKDWTELPNPGIDEDWFLRDGTDDFYVKNGGTQIRFRVIRADGFGQANVSTGLLSPGQFQMFTFSYNGTTSRVYFNGTKVTEHNFTSNLPTVGNGNASMVIGALTNADFDELAWYSRALTEAEITTLYDGGAGTFYSDTVTLNKPTNNSGLFNPTIEFNASFISSGENNLTNATYRIWFENGTLFNETISIVSGKANSSIVNISNFNMGYFDWNVEICESNGASTNCGFHVSNLSFFVGNLTENFGYTLTEGQITSMALNVSFLNINTDIIAELVWNNTNYPSTKTILDGNTVNFDVDLVVPSDSGNSTGNNISHFWRISIPETSINFSSIPLEQTVFTFDMDNCSSLSNRLYNFTVFDEQEQTFIPNATLEAALNVYSYDRQERLANISLESTNPLTICTSAFPTNGNLVVDATIKYYQGENYAIEYYNIFNTSLNESTSKNISLYDLNVSFSTDFQFSFVGEDFLPVAEALVYIEREYLTEDIFKIVELPITDSEGKTIIHMQRNDIRYNIRVIKNGEVLGNFEDLIAFCRDFTIGDCRIDLNAQSSRGNVFQYNEEIGLFYSPPVYDSNLSRITFEFSTNDGLPKLVSLNVTRNDVFGNRTLCHTASNTASGTLICPISSQITDAILIATVGVDGQTALISIININQADYGTIGYIAWFILTLVLILSFGESRNGIIISLLISYVGAVTLGLSAGSIIGVTSAGIWVITISLIALWKLNKERPQ